MKKYIYSAICSLFCIGYSNYARALYYDFTPLNPSSTNYQFDAPGAVASAIELASSAGSVKVTIDNIKEDLKVDELEHHLSTYVTNLANTTYAKTLKKLSGEKKVTSWSRTIDEKTKVNLEDETEIQKAFIEKFLQYPSKKDKINKDYRKIGEQFKIDTTLEMYIVARGMEKQLEKQLKELDKIEKCLVGGEECDAAGLGEEYNCQAEKDSEDQMCLWRANLLVARIYNRIMWYNEFLIAMEAQYNATMMIENGVHIRKYQEKENDKSASLSNIHKYQTAELKYSWQADFASLEWFEGSSPEAQYTQDGDFDIIDGVGGFAGSLSGQKDTYGSMTEIEDANRAVEKAMRAHNVKNKLDSFRRVYESYDQAKRYLKKVMEHLAISEECVYNYLGQYYQNGMQAWTGHNCTSYDEGRIACVADGENEGSGQFNIPCPNDANQTCYVTEITDMSNRSGIYALLKGRYDEAKSLAASGEVDIYTSTESETNFVTFPNTTGEDKNQLRSNGLQNDDEIESRGNSMGEHARSKSPNVEDEMLDETRAANRINWLIGSGISRSIVSDINSGNSGFGSINNRYPLWNDQKEFYDQYINGKIAAMKQYISTVPAIKVIINWARTANSLSKNTNRQEEAEKINELEEILSAIEEKDAVNEAIKEEQTALENLRTQHQHNLAYIKDKIAEESAIIEALNEEIDVKNKEINQYDEQAEYSDTSSKKSEDDIRREREMYANRENEGGVSASNITSPYERDFNKNIEKSEAEIAAANAALDDLKEQAAALEAQLEQHEKIIEKLREALNIEIKNYVKIYTETQRTYRGKVEAAAKAGGMSGVQQKAIAAMANVEAVGTANAAIQCLRKKIIEKIENAEQKYQQMQSTNDIYYPENTAQIQKIHTDMIDEINKIDDSALKGCAGIDEEILASLSAHVLVEGIMSICEKDYCTTPETDNGENAVYFVSLNGRARDFRAPTGPLAFSLPALREVFYFDEVDYNNTEKYFEGEEDPIDNRLLTITDEGFLNSGAEIPEIWRYILNGRTFVEKGFDLQALFNRGNQIIATERSGIFPCHYKGKIIDASYEKFSANAFTKKFNEKIIFAYNPSGVKDNVIDQTCRLFEDQKAELIDTESDYAVVIPYMEILPNGTVRNVPPTNVLETSELGQILAYVEEPTIPIFGQSQQKPKFKLSFNPAFLNAVNNINYAENVDEDNRALEQFKYALRIIFRHNQFGDYLDFIELKAQTEEMLERYKEQMTDVHQRLQEIFNEFGDTISEDFDLANEEDYTMAGDSLDGYKAAFMRKANEKLKIISSMEIAEDIQKRVDKIANKLKLLEIDENEVAEISGSEDVAELEYKIKQATANNGIAEEYNDKGAEEIERQIRQLPKPYCAVYAK